MEEEKEIKDAEISETKKEESEKKNYRTEIILIFIIGLLAGVMIKAEAVKRISIGFDDYRTVTRSHGYDIEAIEKQLIEDAKKEKEAAEQGSAGLEGGEEVIIEESEVLE
ncbi:MAG: hypothetical protein PHH24_01175 [Candidatus Moranbacteria bacterium]|jgi:hypothetical protein|nr:hypothetical protein [Candidatus Moranbacteria bacterium]MDD5652025.1 hypothetical protein [Candidatus Moranbacteria bacterium]MDX9855318.1 hypothetical protein [Candidatus Moranbacteria bacterium]